MTNDPAALYLATLAPSTRRVMAGDLRTLADLAGVDWHVLDPGRAAALREAAADRWAPGTANRALSALRGVVRAMWRAGDMSWDAHFRLLASLPAIKGGRVTRGRSLTWDETCKLLGAAVDLEERALLAVLVGGGLRRAEAAALLWTKTTRQDRIWHVRILGKGNRERRLRLPKWAGRDLGIWSRRCEPRERVFRWRDGASIRTVVVETARRAGLGHVSAHDLRRTFFALSRASGMDLSTIRRTMGHSSIVTTIKYDRRSDDDVMRESEALDDLEHPARR